MNAYKKFSYCYDEVMQELDYHLWLDFTLPYLKPGDKVLDLACGSGIFLTMLKLKGFDTTGLDLSETIIEIAKEKAKINRLDINFLVEDMTKFNLNEKFDCITCFFDSVNFIENKKDLKEMFVRVSEHLNSGGYFIFDTFSKEMMKEYENHHLQEDHVTFTIDWKTTRNNNKLTHNIKITDEETYQEKYYEYYYDLKDFYLNEFNIIKICGDFNDDLMPEDERILYVLQKK